MDIRCCDCFGRSWRICTGQFARQEPKSRSRFWQVKLEAGTACSPYQSKQFESRFQSQRACRSANASDKSGSGANARPRHPPNAACESEPGAREPGYAASRYPASRPRRLARKGPRSWIRRKFRRQLRKHDGRFFRGGTTNAASDATGAIAGW